MENYLLLIRQTLKVMKQAESFFKIIESMLQFFRKQYSNFDDLIIHSDKEELERLLKTQKDKLEFQKAVNNVCKTQEPQIVKINGKEITLSI